MSHLSQSNNTLTCSYQMLLLSRRTKKLVELKSFREIKILDTHMWIRYVLRLKIFGIPKCLSFECSPCMIYADICDRIYTNIQAKLRYIFCPILRYFMFIFLSPLLTLNVVHVQNVLEEEKSPGWCLIIVGAY